MELVTKKIEKRKKIEYMEIETSITNNQKWYAINKSKWYAINKSKSNNDLWSNYKY